MGVNLDMNPQDAQTHCTNIEQRLQEIMGSKPAFVKLSSRSPKDYTDSEKLKQWYIECMQDAGEDLADAHENEKLLALRRARMRMLKSETARDAMTTLLGSERIYQDIQLALRVLGEGGEWNEHIVVREFVDLEPDMEFRAFVCDRRLTGISQYSYTMFHQRVFENCLALGNAMSDCFQDKIFPLLSTYSAPYVIDFAVELEPGGTDAYLPNIKKVWVIEINPFLETTDSALFDWKKDRDLLEGRAPHDLAQANGLPFEFRVNSKKAVGNLAMIQTSNKDVIRDVTFAAKERKRKASKGVDKGRGKGKGKNKGDKDNKDNGYNE